MSYNTSQGRAEYIASAGQTVFTFTFKIFSASDLEVYLTPSGNVPNDAIDILLLTTDYTVTINGDLGGDVTLNSGASLSDAITIARNLPNTRTTEYQNRGDLTATALNNDQNYQTYQNADNDLKRDRSLQFPTTAQGISNILPNPYALYFLQWNADGTALQNVNSLEAGGILWTASDVYLKSETYSKTAIDTVVANRRKQYAKETLPRDVVVGDVSAGKATITLTADENLYGRVVITDTGTLTSVAGELIVGASVRDLIVVNNDDQDYKVWIGSGGFATIASGEEAHLYCDGTNVSLFDLIPNIRSSVYSRKINNQVSSMAYFNGVTTLAIIYQEGYSSITRDSVGTYSFTFSTPMATVNYIIGALSSFYTSAARGAWEISNKTVNGFTLRFKINDAGAYGDAADIEVFTIGGSL